MPYKDLEVRRKYHREYQRQYYYGITPEDIERMLLEQDGKCAICKQPLKPGKGTHLDHNHRTGTNRGLLCFKCNYALGLLDENLQIVYNLITYIEKYR